MTGEITRVACASCGWEVDAHLPACPKCGTMRAVGEIITPGGGGKNAAVIGGILALLIAGAGGGWYWFERQPAAVAPGASSAGTASLPPSSAESMQSASQTSAAAPAAPLSESERAKLTDDLVAQLMNQRNEAGGSSDEDSGTGAFGGRESESGLFGRDIPSPQDSDIDSEHRGESEAAAINPQGREEAPQDGAGAIDARGGAAEELRGTETADVEAPTEIAGRDSGGTEKVVRGSDDSLEFERGRIAANSGDFRRARALWEPLADRGHVGAQFGLGRMYARGDGVGKDFKRAFELFKAAADNGHPKAMYNIGQMYLRGDGVRRDDSEAIRWFQKAAEAGSDEASERLLKISP